MQRIKSINTKRKEKNEKLEYFKKQKSLLKKLKQENDDATIQSKIDTEKEIIAQKKQASRQKTLKENEEKEKMLFKKQQQKDVEKQQKDVEKQQKLDNKGKLYEEDRVRSKNDVAESYESKNWFIKLFMNADIYIYTVLAYFKTVYALNVMMTTYLSINLIINIILFALIITYIIAQICLIYFDMHFILGWLYLAGFLMIILFLARILNSLFIFFNHIVNDERFNSNLVFSNYILLTFKQIVSNYSTSIPFVLLVSMIYSCIKLIPLKMEYIYTPVIFFCISLFFIFIITNVFLKRLLIKSGNFLSKIFLYLFFYVTITLSLISFFSKFTDLILDAILVKIKTFNLDEYGDSLYDDDEIKYNLSKRIKNDYVILQDIPDFRDVSGFAYFMSMIVLIFLLIIDVLIIIETNKPLQITAINNILKFGIDKLYMQLGHDDI